MSPDGTFNSAAVAAGDEGLQRVMRDGLDMEVLSWKMMIEEPTAASLISQALNTAHNMALHTSELTALSVLSGAVGKEMESAVAGLVCFETVRERVRIELDMYVDQVGFIDLFEFVVNMGANANQWILHLLKFGEKFVDPKQRQLSLQAFADVNKIGLQFPRTKIAMVMRSYKKPPSRTWCPVPEAAWTSSAKAPSLPKLEALLRFFQCTCKPAVAGMRLKYQMALMSNVFITAADAFVLCKEPRADGGGHAVGGGEVLRTDQTTD